MLKSDDTKFKLIMANVRMMIANSKHSEIDQKLFIQNIECIMDYIDILEGDVNDLNKLIDIRNKTISRLVDDITAFSLTKKIMEDNQPRLTFLNTDGMKVYGGAGCAMSMPQSNKKE